MPSSPLLVIAGPTAVGKTAIAVAAAGRLGAEIVSADSRTVYRGLDIGTAKPSRADRAAAPHHLLDVAAPDEVFTVADYQRLARAAIAEIRARGRVPMLLGGTGLYLRAVVDGVAIPAVAPDWPRRARLEEEERAGGAGTLHRRLAEVDPEAAAAIHPRNLRRVIRALELYERTGAPRAAPRGEGAESAPLMVALTLDRGRLYARIDRRLDQMIADGLVDEVRRLLDAGVAPALPAMQGLGYKELVPHIRGEIGLLEAVERLRRNTRRYAKRQWTWFRADPRYRWIDVDDDPPDVVAEKISAMMALRRRHAASDGAPGRL
ncbi:MAG TPA: tRNA (adenosine(37)-N6)-dimethylallyltransferase MiaA [bacterium]|nr:tRNA (adenosine(37)-N6)-dimethylallyltransferase MiaA [bacterium]